MPAAGAPERLVLDIRAERFPPVGDAPGKLALRDLRPEVEAGAFVALVGPSGCGKTTTLNVIAGLDRELEGRIALPPATRIGYVFQSPRLLPWRTVRENVALVLDADQRRSGIVDELLAEMDLGACITSFRGSCRSGWPGGWRLPVPSRFTRRSCPWMSRSSRWMSLRPSGCAGCSSRCCATTRRPCCS